MAETAPEQPVKQGVLTWLKKRLSYLAGLLVALAIMAVILIAYLNNPDFFDELKGYGYLGAFVISIILNGTLLLPVSNVAVMIAIGATVSFPWLVGIAGSTGAVIGEMTGYIAGRSGRGLLARSKVYNRVEGWVRKWGWLAVFILSIVPFLFDIVGIIAGALRMPVWRFMLACWAGRTIFYVFAVWTGSSILKFLPWFD